jgi:hypothetical protein
MKATSHWYKEEVIERKIVFELPTVKKSYEKYCKDL